MLDTRYVDAGVDIVAGVDVVAEDKPAFAAGCGLDAHRAVEGSLDAAISQRRREECTSGGVQRRVTGKNLAGDDRWFRHSLTRRCMVAPRNRDVPFKRHYTPSGLGHAMTYR